MLRTIACFSVILLILLSFSCQNQRGKSYEIKHVVLCWLKDKSPESRESFLKAVESLRKVPSVNRVEVGSLILSSEPVADNSFDIGFIVSFNSKSELDAYIAHPDHVKTVEAVLKPSLKKVIVYDFESK